MRDEAGLAVVNWPLLGRPYFGHTWAQTESARRSGWVVADPSHVIVDWAMARGPKAGACKLALSREDDRQNWYDKTPLPARGTIVLPERFVGNALAFGVDDCGDINNYAAKLWAKAPGGPPKYKWPLPGTGEAGNYWTSEEGHQRMNRAQNSSKRDGGSGGGGKCKSQCRLEAGQCRTSCQGAKCGGDCNKTEAACKAAC